MRDKPDYFYRATSLREDARQLREHAAILDKEADEIMTNAGWEVSLFNPKNCNVPVQE